MEYIAHAANVSSVIGAGFSYKQTKQSQQLHDDGVSRTETLHEHQIRQSQEYLACTFAQAETFHNEAQQQSRKHFEESIKHSHLQHKESLAFTRRAEFREAARDAHTVQSAQTNTLLVCATLMLACAFALLVEGTPPAPFSDDSQSSSTSTVGNNSTGAAGTRPGDIVIRGWTKDEWRHCIGAYSGLQGCALGMLMGSIFCGYTVMRRLARYTINTTAHLKSNNSRHAQRAGPFNEFFKKYCSMYERMAQWLLMLGSLALMGALGLLQTMRYAFEYGASSSVIPFCIILGSATFFIVGLEGNHEYFTRSFDVDSDLKLQFDHIKAQSDLNRNEVTVADIIESASYSVEESNDVPNHLKKGLESIQRLKSDLEGLGERSFGELMLDVLHNVLRHRSSPRDSPLPFKEYRDLVHVKRFPRHQTLLIPNTRPLPTAGNTLDASSPLSQELSLMRDAYTVEGEVYASTDLKRALLRESETGSYEKVHPELREKCRTLIQHIQTRQLETAQNLSHCHLREERRRVEEMPEGPEEQEARHRLNQSEKRFQDALSREAMALMTDRLNQNTAQENEDEEIRRVWTRDHRTSRAISRDESLSVEVHQNMSNREAVYPSFTTPTSSPRDSQR